MPFRISTTYSPVGRGLNSRILSMLITDRWTRRNLAGSRASLQSSYGLAMEVGHLPGVNAHIVSIGLYPVDLFRPHKYEASPGPDQDTVSI